ncbi:Nucleic acid-binding OB-fold-like protein [Klebsormidium nitens]|uniref:Nucleic acid-binding OB-fold-like protein n=1 Tax=Klebsormidium nitens TaxID=105231 RepID=A0A1Y1HVR1_KLENI|nr:Nucleic acid-binding OB-fold-like protein [Klebsormidium nitens]|eukprot:GAQ82714.1 Nucleic acid-binding OB-fold-like protein [Klebsormidium nitens]
MSRARKHVSARALGECPELGPNERIMRVVAPRGSNLIEVEDPAGKSTLALLPAKFQKMLWVRRGSFVMVDEADRERAEESGGKVTGTISCVLFPDHVRELRKRGSWPAAFDTLGAEEMCDASEQTVLERATHALGQTSLERTAEATSLEEKDALNSENVRGTRAESEPDSEGSDDEGRAPLERNPNHGNRPGDDWQSSSEESDDEKEDELRKLPSTALRTSR